MELNERKQKILEAIIRNYMETGEPVGSRTVSKYTDLNLSSATIRNEMSDLEEMGYILQPHTSAGRIPSDKAYRLYVDTILQRKDEEVSEMKELMVEKADKIDLLLQQVAKLLAQNTNYTSMVTKPKYQHKRIKFIQLNQMSERQLLVIVVLDNNHVSNKFINLMTDADENVIAQMNFLMNTALTGLDFTEINMAIMQQIKEKAGEYGELASSILDCISEVMTEEDDSEIYTSGATNILKYPELSDKEKMTGLLSTFEEKQMLSAWANDEPPEDDKEHGIQVYIGEESPVESMKDCSVVTATYRIKEGVYGKIGIVGPKRMDYEKVVGTLEKSEKAVKKKAKKDKKDEKIEELNDRLMRNLAEFENFRNRSEKEKSAMFEIGAKSVVEKMLPVVDNLERGFDGLSDEEKETPFAKGIEAVYKQLLTGLEEIGVTPIEAVGKEFDPNFHNAVMHDEDDSDASNQVIEEFQKGYMYKDSVVRHSMVKVLN